MNNMFTTQVVIYFLQPGLISQRNNVQALQQTTNA